MSSETTTAARPPAFLSGVNAPVQREIEADRLAVRGALPRGLSGTLFRNGPNPQFPDPHSHWFVGDGMLHAISLEDGAARYRNRWVRTPKWQAEHRAGRALYHGFGGRNPDMPAWAGDDSGAANTNIVFHGGKLLALEEAHPPTRIDPHDLATLGYAPLGGQPGACTAHPKIDPVTGELLYFAYNAGGAFTPTISFGVIDRDGAPVVASRFEAPYASMIHDFAVTDRHVLFPVLPLTGSMDRARSGRPLYAWEPDKGAYVGVMSRAVGVPRWFRGEACYVFHVMNAWEEGDRIIAEVMALDEPPLFPHADGSPGDPARQKARLTRWTFDLAGDSDRFTSSRIDDLSGEFPRIDHRRAGLKHRHGWFASERAGSLGEGLDGLAHIDGVTGRRTIHQLPEGDAISEPVFAPRGTEEGDGWLLAVAWRARTASSELLVFEACDLAAGPVAVVQMPQRIPAGFHGNWIERGAMG